MKTEKSIYDFKHELKGCWTAHEALPEAAVAYEEERLRALYRERGLDIMAPIHYGTWCGRESTVGAQDIVVATKGGLRTLCNYDGM